MLNYAKNLPEAQTFRFLPAWVTAMESENEAAMLALLRGLSQEERGQMRSFLRILEELDHREGIWKGGHEQYKRISLKQDDLLELCRFVSYTEADIKRRRAHLAWELPMGDALLSILAWYKPGWFSEVYLPFMEQPKKFRPPFDYRQAIACERMGAMTLSPKSAAGLVSNLLSSSLWRNLQLTQLEKKNPEEYQKILIHEGGKVDIQGLLREFPEILKRDIWTIFMEDCGGIYSEGPLLVFLCEQAGSGVLDRMRMLRECLMAAGRNLPKNQIGIYPVLFEALKPTSKELADLRDDLMAVLASPHSKPVAAALKYLKTIAAEPGFPYEAFAGYLPALLSSTVKAVQTAALAVAEVVAKKWSEARPALVLAMVTAFSGTDEGVQTRAAKFLLAYAKSPTADQRAELGQYRGTMTAVAKELMGDWLRADSGQAGQPETALETLGTEYTQAAPLTHLDESMRVPFPQTVDDLVFMLSEAFVRPEDHHCSSVPDSLFAFRDQLDDAMLVRLGPALTAARKTLSTINLTLPVHSRMPAFFFARWFMARLEASDSGSKALAALKKKLPELRKEAEDEYVVYEYDTRSKYERHWHRPELHILFSTLREVVKTAFDRLETGDILPMLSSVTHAPCWVSPYTLVERLIIWQNAGREPNGLDLQLALQRCAREALPEALAGARQLTGEYRAVLEYLASGELPVNAAIKHPAWWVTAALMGPKRRVPQELVKLGFEALPPECLSGEFSWDVVQIKTDGPNSEKEFTTTSTQLVKLNLTPRIKHSYYYADFKREPNAEGDWKSLFAGRMFLHREIYTTHQTMALYPNNPEPLVMDILGGYGREKYWLALATFNKLLELRVPQGPASNLFLALGMLTSAKELRLHAAAFWRAKVDDGTIDSADVGRIIGRLEADDWVPTKRFTDLVEQEMLGVSPEHSRQLGLLLGALLQEIGPKPPVNIKRMLELYYELAAAKAVAPEQGLAPHLDEWAQEKAYATAVKRLRGILGPGSSRRDA